MSALQQLLIEDCRLAELTILAESAGYQASDQVLYMMLGRLGHMVAMDTLMNDLRFLEESELVHVDQVGEIRIAKLTQRGLDVAAGRTVEPGVARPRPG